MMRCNLLLKAMLIVTLFNFPLTSNAQEQTLNNALTQLNTLADRTYVAFGIALNEFRSINLVLASDITFDRDGLIEEKVRDSFFPLTAQTYATSFTLGTYITDNFKTELRYGMGIRDDTLMEAMDININYWLNWYIGPSYPVTDYMTAYALYGVSHYDADVTRRERKLAVTNNQNITETYDVQPSRLEMEEDLFGTSFSTSWLLGIDFHLVDQWYLAVEYGRLLRDTDTNIKVYQAGTYLRYIF